MLLKQSTDDILYSCLPDCECRLSPVRSVETSIALARGGQKGRPWLVMVPALKLAERKLDTDGAAGHS